MISNFRRFLGVVTIFAVSGCQEAILHDLNELRANQVLVTLATHGIQGEKRREGALWSVMVAGVDITRALRAIEESRILKRDLARQPEDSAGMLRSKEEREHAIKRDVAQSLEQTLEKFRNVLEARVHLFSETQTEYALLPDAPKSSASVLLVYQTEASFDVGAIQKLVAASTGIIPERVEVLTNRVENSIVDSPITVVPINENGSFAQNIDLKRAGSIVLAILSALFISRLMLKKNKPRIVTNAPIPTVANGKAPNSKVLRYQPRNEETLGSKVNGTYDSRM